MQFASKLIACLGIRDIDNTQNMMFEVESGDQSTHSVIDKLEFTQQNNFDSLSPLDMYDNIVSTNVPLNNISQIDPNFENVSFNSSELAIAELIDLFDSDGSSLYLYDKVIALIKNILKKDLTYQRLSVVSTHFFNH